MQKSKAKRTEETKEIHINSKTILKTNHLNTKKYFEVCMTSPLDKT